jgi:hypothetical protein
VYNALLEIEFMLQNEGTTHQFVPCHDIPFSLHISGKYKSIPFIKPGA